MTHIKWMDGGLTLFHALNIFYGLFLCTVEFPGSSVNIGLAGDLLLYVY